MEKEICQKIYKEIFCCGLQTGINIFLCGGASGKDKVSYRDKLCKELKHISGVDVLYPEHLFMELLNRNHKKYDLLQLEQFLADNSDYIVIVCESPGSFAELGAFVNNPETMNKVIVLLQTKYKNANSFIRQGPVAYVQSKDKKRVIFYRQEDVESAAEAVGKYIYPKGGAAPKKDGPKLNTMSGLRDFLLLLLYFKKRMAAKELVGAIRALYQEECGPLDRFEMFYSAAVRWCFRERQIAKTEDEKYELTDKGYQSALQLLSRVRVKGRTKVFNDIRMQIMYNEEND